MDPVKVVIFVLAFVALLVLGRMLAASSEVHASALPRPEPISRDDDNPGSVGATLLEGSQRQPLTGAEFGFPFRVPPVRRSADGTYNRPNFTDYYFSKTDLVRGPEDPTSFLDDLYLKAEDPENGHVGEYHFTVTTPSGLRRIMEEEEFASLYFEGSVVVVPRWDLAEILHTAVEEIIKGYGHKQFERDEAAGGDRTDI